MSQLVKSMLSKHSDLESVHEEVATVSVIHYNVYEDWCFQIVDRQGVIEWTELLLNTNCIK